jgi:hypothetical protein
MNSKVKLITRPPQEAVFRNIGVPADETHGASKDRVLESQCMTDPFSKCSQV